jgi:hypothetical protein
MKHPGSIKSSFYLFYCHWLRLLFLFSLMKKETKKSRRTRTPAPRDQSAVCKSAKKKYRFPGSFKLVFSSIIISVAVHTYNNIKIEKYRGSNHSNENQKWVSIKLITAFIKLYGLRLRVAIKCRSYSSTKA